MNAREEGRGIGVREKKVRSVAGGKGGKDAGLGIGGLIAGAFFVVLLLFFAGIFFSETGNATEEGRRGEQGKGNPQALSGVSHPLLRGMALGLHNGGEFDYRPAIDEIEEHGADAVEFVIPFFQCDVHSDTPGPRRGRTPPPDALANLIRYARRRNLDVFLLPIVLLEKAGKREWRGRMTPTDTDLWWKNYRRLLLDVARAGEKGGAMALSVGSELVWSERFRWRWEDLIRRVRGTFSGYLLYSANWDHYEPVTFWQSLDAIGISGYYELTRNRKAGIEELQRSWEKIRDEILAWQATVGKPLVFTEVGYPAVDGGAVYPWNYTMEAERDDAEQARGIEAFRRAWRKTPQLAAAFIYEWGVPGDTENHYSPRGRVAETFLRRWFAADYAERKERRKRWNREVEGKVTPAGGRKNKEKGWGKVAKRRDGEREEAE
ncbi:MAG: hypothetical protein D6679_14195 [Candidatus Hydrogenedentota bacterium]|nr:MAG: hypothetical protein D6679_14195 [Candidatus Hydrogenedentota bacterium]